MPETSQPTDRTALADAIEHALTTTGGLVHPGTTKSGPIALTLPMFNNTTMPDEMARHFAEDAELPHANAAKLVAEALADAVLKNAGEAAAAAIRQAAKAPTPKAAPPAPTPAPKPSPAPRPAAKPTGPTSRMTVILNGETIMTDLGQWEQRKPEQIANHFKNPLQAPAWAKALMAAMMETATTGRAQHVDITTTDDGTWTMQVTPA